MRSADVAQRQRICDAIIGLINETEHLLARIDDASADELQALVAGRAQRMKQIDAVHELADLEVLPLLRRLLDTNNELSRRVCAKRETLKRACLTQRRGCKAMAAYAAASSRR